MSLLVVGSVALDGIETPFGQVDETIGGSAVHFALAASLLHPVQVVGVVGDDYPLDELSARADRGIDWSGVQRAAGPSFLWRGRYSFDLQNRETLETRLGVFATFQPELSAAHRSARFVFLGNIDPELQLRVLDQVQPTLVACDTMNFWISSKRDALLELMRRVDLLILNDAEARELAEDWNVHRAARWMLAHGPKRVVIKQGEHGALLCDAQGLFHVPGYPLEEIFDPTGAGDAFAGGFMGYLARSGTISSDTLRAAMVYGSAMGSFAVTGFGTRGIDGVTLDAVQERVRQFRALVQVPALPLPPIATEQVVSQYAAAGVDLVQAEDAKARIGRLVAETRTPLSLGEIGAFGGMVRIPEGMQKPVLVMSTDGVGTKVLVAMQAGRFDTVGEDLVNHSVNDILVHGATPLAFMDYIAGHRLPVEMIAGVVEGIARGCRAHGMALAGGETAAMPGLYTERTFDLAGTIIGVHEEDALLHGDRVRPGDVLIAYASTGLHTNGYTLARSVLFDTMGLGLDALVPGTDTSVADALLAVHRSYASAIRPVLPQVHALAHITGGGIGGNLVRVLPDDCQAIIDTASWTWPSLYQVIAEGGRVSVDEMRDVFNLGVGMIAVVDPADVARVQEAAAADGVETWLLGQITGGPRQVQFTP